jgi:rubrerythrin
MARKAIPARDRDWLRRATPWEAVLVARRMEATAVRAYTELARRTPHPASCAKFRFLAAQERMHKRFLDRLARVLPRERAHPRGSAPAPPHPPATVDLPRAVRFALHAERRAQAVYAILADRCRTARARKAFRILGHMEGDHADLLHEELDALKGADTWGALEHAEVLQRDMWT